MAKQNSNKALIVFLIALFYYVLVFHNNLGAITITSIFCLLVLLSSVRSAFNKNTMLLLAYGVSFAMIMFLKGGFDISSVADTILPPFCFYLFGRIVVDYYYPKQEKMYLFLLLTAFFFGSYFYYWTLYDMILTGNIVSPQRFLTIQDASIGATLVGTNVSLGFVGISVFSILKDAKLRFGFLVVWILSILATVHMLNRSGIIITFICLAIVLLVYFKNTKHFSRMIFVVSFLVIVVVILEAIPSLQDVFVAYSEREVAGDDSALLSGGGRTSRWIYALEQIPSNPFGWENYGWVHNMWLDVAKQAGWIPFIFLVAITIKCINSARRIVRTRKDAFSCTILGLNLCMFLAAMVEPVMGGAFFGCYCMLWGFQERYCSLIIRQ